MRLDGEYGGYIVRLKDGREIRVDAEELEKMMNLDQTDQPDDDMIDRYAKLMREGKYLEGAQYIMAREGKNLMNEEISEEERRSILGAEVDKDDEEQDLRKFRWSDGDDVL